MADLADCTKGGPSGTDCLLAPIDLDVSGNPVQEDQTWTGTLPNGTLDETYQLQRLDLELGQRSGQRRQYV